MKFNEANDRHLNRLNEKAEDAGTYLLKVSVEVKDILGDDYYEKQAKSDYENLQDNFTKVMSMHRSVESTDSTDSTDNEY